MDAIRKIVFNHRQRPTASIVQLTGDLVAAATNDQVDTADIDGKGGAAYTLYTAADQLARAMYAAEGLAAQIAGNLQANPFGVDTNLTGNHAVASNRVADRITQLEQAATAYRQTSKAREEIRTQLFEGASAADVLATLDALL